MTLIDQYRCLVECYYGVMELDEYDLKVYLLKKIENDIRNFVNEYKIDDFDYKKDAERIKNEVPIKTKLQSCLIVLNKMNAPMEVILIVKKRLKELN